MWVLKNPPMINFLLLIVEPMWLDSGKLGQISLKNNSIRLERPIDGHISLGPKVHYYCSNYVRHQTKSGAKSSYLFHPSKLLGVISNREREPALQSGL